MLQESATPTTGLFAPCDVFGHLSKKRAYQETRSIPLLIIKATEDGHTAQRESSVFPNAYMKW